MKKVNRYNNQKPTLDVDSQRSTARQSMARPMMRLLYFYIGLIAPTVQLTTGDGGDCSAERRLKKVQCHVLYSDDRYRYHDQPICLCALILFWDFGSIKITYLLTLHCHVRRGPACKISPPYVAPFRRRSQTRAYDDSQ